MSRWRKVYAKTLPPQGSIPGGYCFGRWTILWTGENDSGFFSMGEKFVVKPGLWVASHPFSRRVFGQRSLRDIAQRMTVPSQKIKPAWISRLITEMRDRPAANALCVMLVHGGPNIRSTFDGTLTCTDPGGIEEANKRHSRRTDPECWNHMDRPVWRKKSSEGTDTVQ